MYVFFQKIISRYSNNSVQPVFIVINAQVIFFKYPQHTDIFLDRPIETFRLPIV